MQLCHMERVSPEKICFKLSCMFICIAMVSMYDVCSIWINVKCTYDLLTFVMPTLLLC